jgi:hypothetical protein
MNHTAVIGKQGVLNYEWGYGCVWREQGRREEAVMKGREGNTAE